MSTLLHKKGVLFQQLIELFWEAVISIQFPCLIITQHPLHLAFQPNPPPKSYDKQKY